MKVFSATTTISATPEAIWAILTDAAHYPEWDPNAERIEGRIGLGEKITAYTKLAPGRAFPVTVEEFVPAKKMVWASGMPLGLFRGARSFTLTPQAAGRVEFTVREEFTGLLLGLFASSLPDMTLPFQQFVDGLRERAERQS